MVLKSKLFLLVVLIVAVTVYAQKKGKGNKTKTADLLTSPQCLQLQSSQQLGALCRSSDVLNSILPVLKNLTADQACDADCRCVMGARTGGKCGKSPVDGNTYCRCDYESKATKSPYDILCKTVTPVVTNLCQNSIPIVGGFINNTICLNDCTCSHGYDPKQTHQCSTQNGVKGNKVQYCVCNGAKNK